MSQEEHGKVEEQNPQPSSAELSPSETAVANADAPITETDTAMDAQNQTTETPLDNPTDPTEIESGELTTAEAEVQATVEETTADAETEATEPAIDKPVAEAETDVTEPADEPVAEAEVETAEDAVEEVAVSTDDLLVTEDPLPFNRGDVIDGVVTKTLPTAIHFDLGDGNEGIVPGRELELMTGKMLEALKVGAEAKVYVVNPRNHRGKTILSVNHAMEEMDWQEAEQYHASKDNYDAKIGGYNKGGLIVRFGRLRGFVPQSQIGETRSRQMSGETPEERYGPMVNEPISVKVMEVDRGRNRLILSERAAMREVRQAQKDELISELKVGEVREGRVVSLESFGAFVDIGGAEGLVHITELAWGHLTHPRQAVKVGETIEVEVISIDPAESRIGLSRKRCIGDPWDEIATAYQRGQLVEGEVTKLAKFGAFAKLVDNPEVEGLIHISELSDNRVQHPKDVVQRGDKLSLRIVKIDVKERRLGLSLKAVSSSEYLDMDWRMALEDAIDNGDSSEETESADA